MYLLFIRLKKKCNNQTTWNDLAKYLNDDQVLNRVSENNACEILVSLNVLLNIDCFENSGLYQKESVSGAHRPPMLIVLAK